MAENIHGVSKKQWKKWNKDQQNRFNYVYELMYNNKNLFSHPLYDPPRDKYWKTICWNAAWCSNDV